MSIPQPTRIVVVGQFCFFWFFWLFTMFLHNRFGFAFGIFGFWFSVGVGSPPVGPRHSTRRILAHASGNLSGRAPTTSPNHPVANLAAPLAAHRTTPPDAVTGSLWILHLKSHLPAKTKNPKNQRQNQNCIPKTL